MLSAAAFFPSLRKMAETSIKLLIVGAGITGSAIAFELKRLFAEALTAGRLSVTIWDKARGPGGRMTTFRCPTNPNCHADIGAQYISSSSGDMKKFDRFYSGLREKGLLVDMTASVEGHSPYAGPAVQDMVAPCGMSSLVKHFLTTSEADTAMQREINQITKSSEGKLLISTIFGHKEEFDAVVLTIPVPQILKLQGELDFADLQKLNVKYSSRYTLVLFFPEQPNIGLEFGFKFVENDDVIRYIAVDNIKRGEPAEPAALVVHSTWQFGKEHVEKSKEEVEHLLVDRLYQLFPALPRTSQRKIHKWRYSQVRSKDDNVNDADVKKQYFVLSDKPLIICAGDGFTESSLDGCLESATAASSYLAESVLSNLKSEKSL